jgi:hypothetical protein
MSPAQLDPNLALSRSRGRDGVRLARINEFSPTPATNRPVIGLMTRMSESGHAASE